MKKIALIFITLFCACYIGSNQTETSQSKTYLSIATYSESGLTGDLVTWSDSASKTRTAFMVNPTSSVDSVGTYGGYMRKASYTLPTNVVRTMPAGATFPGFGFADSTRTSDFKQFSSQFTPSGTKTISSGADHYIITYVWTSLKASDATSIPVKATVQWAFFTGRDAPVYSVTFDSSSVSVGTYSGNAKAPEGDLEFSGNSTTTVDGVAWGDKYKFTTTSSPVDFQSTWTYTTANTVPYVSLWNNSTTSEIGLVQTQNYTQHDAGSGIFYSNWTKTSTTRVTDSGMSSSQKMPLDWNWTFEANQYDLASSKTYKPIGFIMDFGSVGTNSGPKYSVKGVSSVVGYPYQSYSTLVALNPKGVTASTVTNVEATVGVALSATKGAVVTSGIAGVGRIDTVTYSPAGYNPIYSSFDFTPNGSGALFATMNLGTKTVVNPLVRIVGKTALPSSVLYDGVTESTYVASVDTANNCLWLLLRRSITGSHTLRVDDVTLDAGTDAADADSGSDAIADSSADSSDSSTDSGFDAGTPWSPMQVTPNQNVGGFLGETYTWQDANNQTRTCYLIHNDALDPVSLYGGYVRNCTYKSGASTISVDSRYSDQPGWGYTVHHLNGGADQDTMSSRRAPGTFRTVFAGKHHMLHEYTWTVLRSQGNLPTVPQVDRAVNITIQYLFSSGRSYPLWIHTIDTTPLGVNNFNADDRSPYGEMKYDGVEGAISGLGWGDHYKFRTTSSPVSLSTTTWDYTAVNTIPHTMLWTNGVNLEMGAVQTENYTTKDSGQGWLYDNWGHTSANKVVSSGAPSSQTMPSDWNWTYQLVQYDIPYDANSKKFAWGTNMGVIGQSTYSKFGDATTGSGYPYRSNSVYFVLGAKGSTDSMVTQVENNVSGSLSATVGTIATTGPSGIGGASAQTISYGSTGYDSVYGVYTLTAASNLFNIQFTLGAKVVTNPVIRVKGFTGTEPNTLVVGGVTLYKDVGYFASVVTFGGSTELWVTLNKSLTGTVSVSN